MNSWGPTRASSPASFSFSSCSSLRGRIAVHALQDRHFLDHVAQTTPQRSYFGLGPTVSAGYFSGSRITPSAPGYPEATWGPNLGFDKVRTSTVGGKIPLSGAEQANIANRKSPLTRITRQLVDRVCGRRKLEWTPQSVAKGFFCQKWAGSPTLSIACVDR